MNSKNKLPPPWQGVCAAIAEKDPCKCGQQDSGFYHCYAKWTLKAQCESSSGSDVYAPCCVQAIFYTSKVFHYGFIRTLAEYARGVDWAAGVIANSTGVVEDQTCVSSGVDDDYQFGSIVVYEGKMERWDVDRVHWCFAYVDDQGRVACEWRMSMRSKKKKILCAWCVW